MGFPLRADAVRPGDLLEIGGGRVAVKSVGPAGDLLPRHCKITGEYPDGRYFVAYPRNDHPMTGAAPTGAEYMKTPTRTPDEIRRRLRFVNARLSDFASDQSRYGRTDAECGRLFARVRELEATRAKVAADLDTLRALDEAGDRAAPADMVAAYLGLCRDPEYVPNLRAALLVGQTVTEADLEKTAARLRVARAEREVMRSERAALQSERPQLEAELKAARPPALVAMLRADRAKASADYAAAVLEAKARGEDMADRIHATWRVEGAAFPVAALPGVWRLEDGKPAAVLDWGGLRLVMMPADPTRGPAVAAIVRDAQGRRALTEPATSPDYLMAALRPFL